MPLISAYFDTSVVSFLIKKDAKSVEFLNFPYVYSKGILSNQCTQQEFYTYLIEKVLSDRKIKPGSCEVLTSGFMDPPKLSLKTSFSVGIVDLVQHSEDFVPVILNNCSFVTKGIINAFSNCDDIGKSKSLDKDFGEFDYCSNLCIYPQTVTNEVSIQSDIDEKIVQKIPSDFSFNSGSKIMFTGGRFAQEVFDKEFNYILMIEALKGLGVFFVHMDTSNAFLLSQTVQMYNRDVASSIEDYIQNCGTFIRTGGAAECLLSRGSGDDQLIEIEKDKVFIMPLKLEKPARLSVKSSALKSVDIQTHGGDIGLVFDTRDDKTSLYSDVKLLNDCVRQIERALANE